MERSELPVPRAFPVGLSNAVEANQVIAAICEDQEYAVWRDSKGTLHANQNNCPHRGMRLSFGFVRDDRLNCLYHGWSYDGQGQCKFIPAHPSITPAQRICLKTFEVREHHATIWLSPDRAALAPQEASNGARTLPVGLEATPVRSSYVAASLASVSGFMDSWTPTPVEGQAWERTRFDTHAETLVLRTRPGAPREGVLYALQDAGQQGVGIHIAALSEGAAPVARLLDLSAQLRSIEHALKNELSPAPTKAEDDQDH